MKKYIYKLVIFTFFLFVAYEITIGREVKFIKEQFFSQVSSFKMETHKDKIKQEIEKSLTKERIFYEDDAKLLSAFIKKILLELELSD